MCQPDGSLQPLLSLRHCDHVRGCAMAQVMLIEYGDFQCPQSGQLYWVFKKLTQQFDQNLCFVFRHLPQVEQHPRAQIAAETAEAAHAQGKFWEMHDLLFEHQNALEDADLLEYAIALDLDVSQFLKQLADHVHLDVVQNNIDSANASGINRTPTTLFVLQPNDTLSFSEIILEVSKIINQMQ
ncbi:MAG: thioredoxin domain-containing protein [Oculatellaceae cyanobacterium bins.114]|nr:thioredoxin domain-containing protein [Oculatellaceae cyanobacterium bins.114]